MDPSIVRSFVRLALLSGVAALTTACGTLVSTSTMPAPVVDATAARALPAAAPAPDAAPAPKTARIAPQRPSDAVPRVERIPQGAPNVPYEIRGETYDPESDDVPMREVGIASWYGRPFHGRLAASGERYDMDKMTAAHPTMPLPSYARVRNLANGREVVVRVNDRGPFHGGRIIDLSRAAARKLGIGGTALVEIERLTNDDIRTGAWRERRPTDMAARKPAAARTLAQGDGAPRLPEAGGAQAGD